MYKNLPGLHMLPKTLKWLCFCLIFFAGLPSASAWNAAGHRIAVQIAYNNLTPHAKKTFNQLNQSLNKVYRPENLVNASVWLDRLRYSDISWFDEIHFIEDYFAFDDTVLPIPSKTNALKGIDKASQILLGRKANRFDKGVALRVLIHVIPDIHQPLHTISLVSKSRPEGDKGGNLYELGQNHVSNNLHGFWDKGGGFLMFERKPTQKEIIAMAQTLENEYPCTTFELNGTPLDWVIESRQIAKEFAYHTRLGGVPSAEYTERVKHISKKRIVQSGCRLANFLNAKDTQMTRLENNEQLNRY